MAIAPPSEKIWWKEAEPFLRQIGMPTEEMYAVGQAPSLPKTNFARVDDIGAVPYLSEGGRAAYREYLGKSSPRAFAVSASGAWCWAEEGEAPDTRALASCQQKSDQPCQLYSVDDDVVYQGQSTATVGTAVGGDAPAGSP